MKFNSFLGWAAVFLIPLVLLPFCSAQLTFQPEEDAELKLACFDIDDNLCSSTVSCNITVFYPNMSVLVDNKRMTNQLTFHNYTIPSIQTRGEYNAVVSCEKGGSTYGYSSFNFIVTGMPMTNQGTVAASILLSLIGLAFLFGFIGFKFTESDKTFPIALFFILITLILSVYVIHLGYIYGRDILISDLSTGSQWAVYIGILYSMVGMAFIALLGLVIKTIKEIRVRQSVIRYGEGYDTKTKMYK